MTIAVTGGSGFIGRALCAELHARNIEFVSIGREHLADGHAMGAMLRGCSSAIHLAALAHRQGPGAPSRNDFSRVNRDMAVAFALACRSAGTRRLVFVSTIHVLADRDTGVPLRPDDEMRPRSDYARSKAEAEFDLAKIPSLDVIAIRPPLVYAPGALGNLRLLERLARVSIPLPLASIANKRDIIGRANLVDALIFLALAPGLGGGTYHVKDDEPMSLPELVAFMRRYHGQPPRLFHFPEPMVKLALRVLLGERRSEQLTGDFRIDDATLRSAGWVPPFPAGFDFDPGQPIQPRLHGQG